MEFTINQVAALIGGEIEGDGDRTISRIGGIEDADENCISFLSNEKYESHVYKTRAAGVIVSKNFSPKGKITTTLIRVDDPYVSFTALLEEYDKIISFQKSGIEQPSYIGEGTIPGKEMYLGAFAYLGNQVKLGDHVKIYPHAYVGDNVTIGSNSIIHSGVRLYPGTVVGNHCTVHSGSVIGSDGFGYAPLPDGGYKKIPQLGNVVLEDYVDIGANTVIDCATFGSTIIKEGVKLDNLIQVAHNVEVGKHTVIAAQAGVAGSSKIGENCVIGGQVGIVGHITIANNTKIQAQSGVNKAHKEGAALFGSPAIEYGNYVRSYTIFKKLPEVMKRIQELEQKILNLSPSGKQG